MHNITFSLGDPCGDGHGHYSEYHMESNYSVKDIQGAYETACTMIGFDFTETIMNEYAYDWFLDQDTTNLFLKYNLIDESEVNRNDENYPLNCFYFNGLDDYLNIFCRLIRLILPDFILRTRDLNEERLSILDGAADGLFYD